MKKEEVDKILEVVKDNYNVIAQDFNNSRKKELWPQIITFSKLVKDGDRVLDLACGNGRLIEALKDKNISYLGLDNSVNLINIAKVNYKNYRFDVCDLLDTYLKIAKEKKFDKIFLLAALQHIPSKEYRVKVLQDMKDILVDNGKIIVSNWNLWESKHRKKVIASYFNNLLNIKPYDPGDIFFSWKNSKGEKTSQRYYHAFTKKELVKLAKEAGFKDIKVEKDKYNYWLLLSK